MLVIDASALLAWITRDGFRDKGARIDKLLLSPATCVLPAPALAEALYVVRRIARRQHKTPPPPSAILSALQARRVRVEPATEADAVWAGDAIADCEQQPARWRNHRGEEREGTLSLGDGLVLATTIRLGGKAVTYDEAWQHFTARTFPLFDPWLVPIP